MKEIKHLTNTGIYFLAILVLPGCYTQLAVSNRVSTMERSAPRSEQETVMQEEPLPDTLRESDMQPSSIINEYNYWFADPYNHYFGYNPYIDTGYYIRFNFYWGNSYWDPWYYPGFSPFWNGPYYTGWYLNDPYWCDPYWGIGYYPGFYSWYYPGYYWGYGQPYWYDYWYDGYEFDTLPGEKREWERRGANLTENTIVRPTNSVNSTENSGEIGGKAESVSYVDRPDKGTRLIQRESQDLQKPARRSAANHEKRESKRNNNNSIIYAINNVYREIERSISQSDKKKKKDQNKSDKQRTTKRSKNSQSKSNNSKSVSTHRSSSVSKSSRHSKQSSSGSSRSGRTSIRSSNRKVKR